MKILLYIYQILIAWPLAVVFTFFTSVFTIILSPILPNNNISYFPARAWGRLMCWVFFIKVKTEGWEKLDKTMSAVIVANHQSMFDIFAIYGWLPHFFKWILKIELKKVFALGKACEAAGHIFVDRTNPIAAKQSLEKAKKQLVDGVSLMIFPEGTRTKTGIMGRFKKGGFKIAEDLNLPIIPITIKGSWERVQKGKLTFLVPGTIHLIVHPTIEPDPNVTMFELTQKAWNDVHSPLIPL